MIQFKENTSFKNLRDICIRDDADLTHGLNILYGGNLDLYLATYGHEQELSDSKYGCKSDFLIPNGDTGWLQFYKLIQNIKNDKDKEKIIKDNKIVIYSDDAYIENANKLYIQQVNEGIKFTFFQNLKDLAFNIGIRISNSGSRYDPLNIHFMDMYNEFQELARNQDKKIEDEER